ncbi:SNF2 N-terminal domain family protein [Acanthocheilonema viteae]
MDEGDDYVPQISQLDYSLVDSGQNILQNDPGIYSPPPPQIPLQHLQYGNEAATMHHPCQLPGQMAPQSMQQQQVIQPTQVPQPTVQKPKVQRRRKNATANVEQQALTGQAMLPPSSIPPRQQYMNNMTPMQSMAAMSQNPLMSHMRSAGPGPQVQQQMMSGKHHVSNDMPPIRHPGLPPNVHDPYHHHHQQQQQWFQQRQFRVPNSYPPQHQMYSAQQRPPMNQVMPQQTYYSQQQQIQQDARNPMYYQPHQMYEQVPRYPPSMGPQLGHSQQYYSEQGQNFYPSPNHMMQQSSHSHAMTMHQQVPSGTGDWQQHSTNSQQRYASQPQYSPSTSIQIEIQQVQQQLQSMYEIPNRNMQIAQQIEQLQLRLQYLQQCYMNECHGGAQRNEQPVSVMQRGSEVQVNIKPDMPGHTLISVYHQYPPNSAPATSVPPTENVIVKDCVPPEPIPSRSRTPVEDPSAPNVISVASSRTSNTLNNSMSFMEPQAPMVSGGNTTFSAYNVQQQQQSLFQHVVEPNGASATLKCQDQPKYEEIPESQQQQPGDTRAKLEQESEITDVLSTTNIIVPPACEILVPNRDSEQDTLSEIVTKKAGENSDDSTTNHFAMEMRQRKVVDSQQQITNTAQSSEKKTCLSADKLSDTEGSKTHIKPATNLKKIVKNTLKTGERSKNSRMEVNVQDSINKELDPEKESDVEKVEIKKENTEDFSNGIEEADEKSKKENESEVSEKQESVSDAEVDKSRELNKWKSCKGQGEKAEVKLRKDGHSKKRAKVSQDEELMEISTKATTISQESAEEEEKQEINETDKAASSEKPKRRRGRHPKRGPGKKRKIEEEGEIGVEVDDEEFIPDSNRRTRKRPRTRRLVAAERDDTSFEYVEKRRSGRSINVEKKSYDLQAKWDEMDEEIGEDVQSRKEKKPEEQSEFIIEKIMSMKKNEDGPDLYFVKYKNKAYIHCQWKSQCDLEAGDRRAAAKLKRFHQKRAHSSDQDEDEQFNSDFVIVERVLDANELEGNDFVLIKWKSLPYEEVTWEKIEIIPDDKIEAYKRRNTYDPLKLKPKPHPSASDWSKIPEDITFKDNNRLREYQFEGVNWLLYCYYNKQNCILADEMGLGKTVQTICFLQRVYDYGIHGPFLIVVPLSTIHNWQREFETWTDMNTIVYHGSASSRQIIQQTEFYYRPEDLKGGKRNVVKFDALITTFEMVVSDCDVLKQISYQVCIIDEAHRLKNRNCKLLTSGLLSLTAEHRVLLTGTPLQNNIEELYSLLNFLEPEQFHSSSAFLEQFGQCQTEDQVQRLQDILKPMMLRRLKEDVEKTLQPKEETIIEIQLSNTQKKYYRAILERNFSHLCKGTSVPSLMNAMMELRKCCNHPFLINGAEEQILAEVKAGHPDWNEDDIYQHALVQSSGKLVLIAKLLPKLHTDGHKVLIFSQMVRVLDIIEEFLVAQNYTFERIDGNVRGDLRQSAIDRFSKKDSDRFIFLLCTRAGGLGINLTAADTVIIFDSDWNPQNDLQAQARCHRIGQTKMVKVYRLITCNTYEREMFDKASLKLGLDRAVLQSTTALKDTSQQLSRKEIEELLKKGAYGAIMEENAEESKFNEEDIETILLRRTTTITLEAGVKGSTFAKASFNSSTNREDIDIDDPNFWSKWAKKANIDTEMSQTDKQLIVLEPRNRKKRFEENVYKSEGGDDTEGEESDDSSKARKRGDRKGDRKKRREDEEYRPDELAFNKSEYFKIEKVLGQFGWGRWKVMREASDLKDSVTEIDIEHISRTLLLHCIREYRGDEKIREFVWRLIIPKGGLVTGKNTEKMKNTGLTSVFHEGWAALPEYNPPAFAVDSSFQRHVHRHSNKLLIRMHQLHILNTEIIGSKSEAVMNNAKAKDIDLSVDMNDAFVAGWDAECDKSFLIGAHKHGLENIDAMRIDPALCFGLKKIEVFPNISDLLNRFRRLLTHFQRKRHDSLTFSTWTKREEAEFMRVLRSYGVKDDPSTIIFWTRFRQLSPLLEKKTDSDLMEQLYCVLSMCTKQLGNEITAVDLQRALKVEAISARKAQKLMHRMNMMRQIHDWRESLTDRRTLLKLCSNEAMPSGWSVEQDEELFKVVDEHGLDNIAANILNRTAFQKIVRPEERTLLRRVAEIYTTLQTKKWNGAASTELLEDSDDERETLMLLRSKRGRKKSVIPGAAMQEFVDMEKEKMRALVHQTFLQRLEQLPFAAAAAMAQGAFLLPSLLSGGGTSTTGASTSAQSQAAMLSSLFGLSSASPPATSASTNASKTNEYAEDVLNLSTKKPPSNNSSTSQQSTSGISAPPTNFLNSLNFTELFALANLPPETRVPVINIETGARLIGEQAPKVKNLGQWLSAHPKYVLDIPSSASSVVPPVSQVTSSKPAEKNDVKCVSASSDKITSKKEISKETHSKEMLTIQTNSSSSKAIATALTLEPGEVPRSPSTTAASSSASAASLGIADQRVAVFQRASGTLVSADKWPLLKNLTSWLDKHPDCNVHSSSASLAATVLPKNYTDRLGDDTTSMSSSSNGLETLQMQMMLQQSLMNQTLLGLGAYGQLGSYAMLAAAASGSTQPSKGSSKDVLNPMLASLMNPSLHLQQMQSLLTLDPSLLLSQPFSSIATSSSTLPISSLNVSSVTKPPTTTTATVNIAAATTAGSTTTTTTAATTTTTTTTTTTAAATTITTISVTTTVSTLATTTTAVDTVTAATTTTTTTVAKRASSRGRLNAVVEKLSSNQS